MATVTPNYNWPVPLSTDLVKDGADAIKDLGDAIDATVFGLPSGALTLISATTIGTTVSSVTVNDAFSASYENYLILVSGGTCSSTNNFFTLQLGASTTTYYWASTGLTYAGSSNSGNGNNTSSFGRVGVHHTNGLQVACTVLSPFLSKFTFITADYTATDIAGRTTGIHQTASSYTSFVLNAGAGTLTGGTVYVYGYGI